MWEICSEVLSSHISRWLLDPSDFSLSAPHEVMSPTSHQKDQLAWPAHANISVCSWAVPGEDLISKQTTLIFYTESKFFISKCMWEATFSFCILLCWVCCSLWPSHIGRVVVFCRVSNSVQGNNGWGRVKVLSPLHLFCFGSWGTKVVLLVYFATSQALFLSCGSAKGKILLYLSNHTNPGARTAAYA